MSMYQRSNAASRPGTAAPPSATALARAPHPHSSATVVPTSAAPLPGPTTSTPPSAAQTTLVTVSAADPRTRALQSAKKLASAQLRRYTVSAHAGHSSSQYTASHAASFLAQAGGASAASAPLSSAASAPLSSATAPSLAHGMGNAGDETFTADPAALQTILNGQGVAPDTAQPVSRVTIAGGYSRDEYRAKATSLFHGALRVPKRQPRQANPSAATATPSTPGAHHPRTPRTVGGGLSRAAAAGGPRGLMLSSHRFPQWSGTHGSHARGEAPPRRFTLGAGCARQPLAQQHSPQVAHVSARDRQQTSHAHAHAHAGPVSPIAPSGATAVRLAMQEAAPAEDDARLAMLEAVRQREMELEQELMAEIAKAEAAAAAAAAPAATATASGTEPGSATGPGPASGPASATARPTAQAAKSTPVVAPVAQLAPSPRAAAVPRAESRRLVAPQPRRLGPSPKQLLLRELAADQADEELGQAFVVAVQRSLKGDSGEAGASALALRALDQPVADHLWKLEAQREAEEERALQPQPPAKSPHKFRPLFPAH